MRRIQKTIAEFIDETKPPLALAPTESVLATVKRMAEHHTNCALVVDDGRLVGVFTERDYLKRVVAENRAPADTTLSAVMTADPDSLRPGDCISYAINQMAERGYRNVPIVRDGKPIALLSVRTVVGHLADLFREIDGAVAERPEDDEWVDIGGG